MDKHLESASAAGVAPATIVAMPSRESHEIYRRLGLSELLDLFPERIAQCESQRNLECVFEICRLTRATWSRYLREYSKNGAKEFRERIVAAMEAGRRSMARVTQELSGEDRADAKRSVINVQRRLRFADVLHAGGMDALNDELFRHLDERLAAAA